MTEQKWALILGASSGIGAATALELARVGFDIFGVNLRSDPMKSPLRELITEIKSLGRECVFFRANAADEEKRWSVILQIGESRVGVLVHSLAFGTLLPLVSPDGRSKQADQKQVNMTLNVMANCLIYWTQDLLSAGHLSQGGRIFAITSSGSSRVIQNYGPVAGAKASIEAYVRQLAVELAPRGITANAICAGVVDTPALRKIPNFEKILATASAHNPFGRLTTPRDVGRAIALLCDERAHWITGNVIRVDGGEGVVG